MLVGPAALAIVTKQIFLFPSLGPTAVMLAHEPQHRSSRPYAVLVSHAAGLAAASVSVAIFGIAFAPSVFETHTVSPARAGAVLLALALAIFLEVALRAQHPPAAATTLLVALGSFHPTPHDAFLIMGGVVAVLIVGEPLRRRVAEYEPHHVPPSSA
jgi:CBS-domain-containing membrane protein